MVRIFAGVFIVVDATIVGFESTLLGLVDEDNAEPAVALLVFRGRPSPGIGLLDDSVSISLS